MSDNSKELFVELDSSDLPRRLTWRTPVLTEELISTTQHNFSAGIDRYEGSNPVGYGS